MVRGNEATFVLIEEHERKFDDPEEFIFAGIDRQLAAFDQKLRRIKADATENRTGTLPLTGGEENDIAVFNLE